MKNYTKYTFEELIHDQEFIETIHNISTREDWLKFLEYNKDSKEEILKAKKFIKLFYVRGETLNSDTKRELWNNIQDFNKRYKKSFKVKYLKRISSIAASILIVLSLSGLLYFSLHEQNEQYNFTQSITNTSSDEHTTLTLASGEKIQVQKDDSKISILEKETIQIDNDTINNLQATSKTIHKTFPLNEIIIPFGKKATLVLNDGTKVWLNAGSKFAFPQEFIGKERKVYLDGEGYFEVAHNSKKPFIVSSEDINVEVLGTKFNLSSYSTDNRSETVLLEGSVNVWSSNTNKLIKDKTRMSPNEKVTFNKKENEFTLAHEPNADNYIAWIDGWYKFSNEDIEQVFKKIGRYYNVSFKYDKEKINLALPISGKLYLQESIYEVMSTLSKVAEIDFTIKDEEIIIN